MFHRRTLFVLGAGTSAEVDMPTGEKLAAEIGKKMDVRFDFSGRHVGGGDLQLYQQLTYQRETDAREIQFGGWRIRDGIPLSQSIDDFLDLHRDDSFVNLVGKAAIVKTILEAERRSKLIRNSLAAASTADELGTRAGGGCCCPRASSRH